MLHTYTGTNMEMYVDGIKRYVIREDVHPGKAVENYAHLRFGMFHNGTDVRKPLRA